MKYHQIKLNIILLLFCITHCKESVANPALDGYRYQKPSVTFDYPTALSSMPKTVDTDPTPTATEESVKIETKPKITIAKLVKKENAYKSPAIDKATVIKPNLNTNLYQINNPTTVIKPENEQLNLVTHKVHNDNHHESHKRLKLRPHQSVKEDTNSHSKTCGSDIAAQTPDYVYIKPPKFGLPEENALEQFLNQDDEHIYRLSTNVGKHPIVSQKSKTENSHIHHNGAVKRLKLKHNLHSNKTLSCCDQSLETLKVKFNELSHNRPLERRLSPYTETIIDKEYFE